MPALKNIRHERFCLFIIKGLTPNEAYAKAGYKENSGNAVRLKANESIIARLAELSEKVEEKILLTVERITDEYARIAYSDITDVVEFDGTKLTIKPSKSLPKHVTAAIREIKHTKEGISIRFHDKIPALDALARHKGMFKENIDLKITLSLADLVNQSYQEPKLVEGKEIKTDDKSD